MKSWAITWRLRAVSACFCARVLDIKWKGKNNICPIETQSKALNLWMLVGCQLEVWPLGIRISQELHKTVALVSNPNETYTFASYNPIHPRFKPFRISSFRCHQVVFSDPTNSCTNSDISVTCGLLGCPWYLDVLSNWIITPILVGCNKSPK